MSHKQTIALPELAEQTQESATVAGREADLFYHGGEVTALCGTCPQ